MDSSIDVAVTGIIVKGSRGTVTNYYATSFIAVTGIILQNDIGTVFNSNPVLASITLVVPQLTVFHVVQADAVSPTPCCTYQDAVLDDEMTDRVFYHDTVATPVTIYEPVGNDVRIIFGTRATGDSAFLIKPHSVICYHYWIMVC